MAKGESKSYDPSAVEQRLFDYWEGAGHFKAQPSGDAVPFCVVIPPPNVTGALHLGHALNNTLQDILIRHKRMQGYNTFWLVGTDHAGIATQATVEKTIRKAEGKSRHDLGREELVKRIWDWKAKYGSRIVEQLKLMGCSCDYSRERFTLDEGCAKAVRETFFKLFRDGLIYRGKRLVNWDTELQTAVADDEVYHESVKGHFYHLKYPIKDPQPGEPQFVHVATTRPETMLGDVAVAVHPNPESAFDAIHKEVYDKLSEASARGNEKEKGEFAWDLEDLTTRKLEVLPTLIKLRDMAKAGRKIILPLTNREIPLICDEWAKPELGSGCVKITPAHDPNDYDVAQRHDLPKINVLTADGKVAEIIELDGSANPASANYAGLKFATAGREKVVADLEAGGFLEKIEDRVIEIGHSDRSKSAVEPYLSDQWFVRMGDLEPEHAARIEGLRHHAPGLAQMAIDAVKRGDVVFHPARYEKTYTDWLGEKRDWCISRQLWWGHRIPIWTKEIKLSEWLEHGKDTNKDALTDLLFGSVIRVEDPQTGETWHFVDNAEGSAWAELKNALTKSDRLVRVSICPNDNTDPTTGKRDDRVERYAEEAGFIQDADVLDTWFSSALWPHSTLGWPDANQQDKSTLLGTFYPTNVLSTAREIITLWVARMVMFGLYNIGEIPFKDVVIHPVIQDGQGRKMAKTLGNGVDPVDIIDKYGADALRFTLAELATETQDIRMPVTKDKLPDGREINISTKFEKGRNFCNKLWQASMGFVVPNIEGHEPKPLDLSTLKLEDRWILSRLTTCLKHIDAALAKFRFSEFMGELYRFMWDDYCSAYIEMTKSRMSGPEGDTARQVLAFVLDRLLRMLHPVVPYVTEAVWDEFQHVAPRRGLDQIFDAPAALISAGWPLVDETLCDPAVESQMEHIQAIIRIGREIRTTVNEYLGQSKSPTIRSLPLMVVAADAATCRSFEAHKDFIRSLAQCDRLEVGENIAKPAGSLSRVIGPVTVHVPVANLIDLSLVKATEEKKLAEWRQALERADKQLSNESFVSRADPSIVEAARQRAADLRAQIEAGEMHIKELG